MGDDTEAAIRRVMTPLIGWPRIDAWLREVRAEAWDEGAKAAWESSGEGWNGEYPPGTKHDARNPYREGGAS